MNLEQFDEMQERRTLAERRQAVDHELQVMYWCFVFIVLVLVGVVADKAWNHSRILNWIDGPTAAQSATTGTGRLWQPEQPTLKYLPGRAGQPDAIVILREARDTWQVCAQRVDSDLLDCRPVGEARKWLRERPAVKR